MLVTGLVAVLLAGLGLHLLVPLAGGSDLALVRDAAGARTGTLTSVAHAVSWLGRSAVLLPAAVIVSLASTATRRASRGLEVLLATVGAIIIQNADKALVHRPRPPVPHLEQVSGASFPSGHATESAAFLLMLAVALAPGRRAALALAALVAVAVGASRVYLGVHYPTDVAAGWLLGAAWTAVISYLSRR